MTACCVAAATLAAPSVQALTSVHIQEIKKTVLGVPVPEMPAKAAELVANAQKKDRQAVAVTAVRAVVGKHRAAAPMVISAVSRVAPEVAPAIAVAASEVAVDQAPAIARAAAVSAPAQAVKISEAVAAAVPAQAATVVATVAPIASRGSAAVQSGNVRIEDTPINENTGGGGTGTFPTGRPNEAQQGVVIYNTPRTE
jgi:hypothetical protein